MARLSPIRIEVDGRAYNGAYDVEDGLLTVSSAYGSAQVRPGRSNPDKAARAAFQDVVLAWLKARQ